MMELTEETFEREVIQSQVPTFVFFWASWCTACKRTQETVRELTGTYDGRAKICSVNVDRNFAVAERCTVRGVPSFLVFVAGKEVARGIGAKSKNQLREMIDESITPR